MGSGPDVRFRFQQFAAIGANRLVYHAPIPPPATHFASSGPFRSFFLPQCWQ